MRIQDIVKNTRQTRPPIIMVYGDHGIGKTTFASQAPGCIFIPTEDGQSSVDADSFPLCKSTEQFLAAIDMLASDDHGYRTVAIDSMDWLESIIHAEVAAEAGAANVGELQWGQGYNVAADRMRDILTRLVGLRNDKKMSVIMLAHAEQRKVADPLKREHDRLQIKLHKKAAALIKETADLVGCAYLDSAVMDDGRASIKAPRVLMFDKSDACDSKNRLGIRSPIDFTYAAFSAAFKEAQEKKEK